MNMPLHKSPQPFNYIFDLLGRLGHSTIQLEHLHDAFARLPLLDACEWRPARFTQSFADDVGWRMLAFLFSTIGPDPVPGLDLECFLRSEVLYSGNKQVPWIIFVTRLYNYGLDNPERLEAWVNAARQVVATKTNKTTRDRWPDLARVHEAYNKK